MKALQLFKVLSLTSTMAIAALVVAPLTQTARAKTGYESPHAISSGDDLTPLDNDKQFANFGLYDRPILQAQSRNRQQIAEQVVLVYRQMVGPNAQISRRYLQAYVNCIEQNVCSWQDVRAHIAYTHQLDDDDRDRSDRYDDDRYDDDRYDRDRRRSSSWENRRNRHRRHRRNDRDRNSSDYDRDSRQAQSNDRDRIEEQVRRLHREMLGRNARLSRRDLRDYVNCLDRGRCGWDDIREEIAYSDDGEEAIEDIYEEVLDRDPDRGGMRTYQNRLADDWNIQDVREDIADSDEAERALNRIYRQILGRNADRGGLRTYSRKLAEGWSLDKVRRDIADSDEARRRRGG